MGIDVPLVHIFVKPRYQPPRRVSLDQFRVMLDHGELSDDDPAWVEGLANWVPLSEISLHVVIRASLQRKELVASEPPKISSDCSIPASVRQYRQSLAAPESINNRSSTPVASINEVSQTSKHPEASASRRRLPLSVPIRQSTFCFIFGWPLIAFNVLHVLVLLDPNELAAEVGAGLWSFVGSSIGSNAAAWLGLTLIVMGVIFRRMRDRPTYAITVAAAFVVFGCVALEFAIGVVYLLSSS